MRYERRHQPVASPRAFAGRLAFAMGLWLLLAVAGLAIGMAGYMIFEGMGAVDAFANAAMILSGMGPLSPLQSVAGKLFAGFYAILSGLILIVATGFVLAPIFHRVLHHFHIEDAGRD
jgi:hypothetical protein